MSINIAAKKLLNSSLVSRPKFILAAPKPNIANIPNASTNPTTGCCKASSFNVFYFAFLFALNLL